MQTKYIRHTNLFDNRLSVERIRVGEHTVENNVHSSDKERRPENRRGEESRVD